MSKFIVKQLAPSSTEGDVLKTINGTATWSAETDTTISSFTYTPNTNTFTISDSDGSTFNSTIQAVSGLTVNGDLAVNGESVFSGSGQDVVTIIGSGDTTPIFKVEGSNGELFAITDSLIGSLFAVSDISGLPILEVFSDRRILLGEYQAPALFTTVKVTATSGGTTSVYSIPTSAYTGAFFDYTVSDGTNLRAGSVGSVFSSTDSTYNETSTTDLGNTDDITFSVSVASEIATLIASATTTNWTVKTIVRSI